MKRYFKFEEETGYGPGKNWIQWMEVVQDSNTRLVEWQIDHWAMSLDERGTVHGTGLCSGPLTQEDTDHLSEISQLEFDAIWHLALNDRLSRLSPSYYQLDAGPGHTVWYETAGDEVVRQVDAEGDDWFFSHYLVHPPRLRGSALTTEDLLRCQEISAEEFDSIWQSVVERRLIAE